MIIVSAVHVQMADDGAGSIPYECDILIGRNWAQALQEGFKAQIAPGILQLDAGREGQAICLAWYYLTQFRYQMRKPKESPTVHDLCDRARITIDTRNLSRFLSRLDSWHARLFEVGVIGRWTRENSGVLREDLVPPRTILEQARYHVAPPPPIAEEYERHRLKTATPTSRR
jgi:hypothetical protein